MLEVSSLVYSGITNSVDSFFQTFSQQLQNGEVRQLKKKLFYDTIRQSSTRSFFFIKVFLYLKNRVNELFIRNARFARLKLLLPKNGPSGLFGGSPLNCARKPLRLLFCRRISRCFVSTVSLQNKQQTNLQVIVT